MEDLLGLSGPTIYLIVFLLALAESALLVGLLVPGETALILSGVLVAQGRAELGWIVLAGWLGAVLGDSVSYSLGKRFGRGLAGGRLGRRVGEANWERARLYVQQKGGRAVFGGRFIGILRALVPAVAGWAGMRYRTFLVNNVAGGLLWSAGCIGAGTLAGQGWPLVRDWIGGTSLAAGLLIIFVFGLVWTVQRHNARQGTKPELAGRVLRWSLITVSIGILVHIVGLALPGIKESAGALRRINPGLVAVALALEVVSLWALAHLYLQTLRCLGGTLGFRRALDISMLGFTVSRVVPGGGATAGFLMARSMAAQGISPATAAGAVLVGGGLGMAVLGGMVVAGAAATLLKGDLPQAYLIGIPLLVTLMVGAGLVAFRMLKSPLVRYRVFGGVERILRVVGIRADLATPRRFLDDAAATVPSLRRLGVPARWSALNWLTEAAALWVLFAAFGQWMHPGVLVVGYGAAQLLNALPVSPGGLGLVEAGLAGTYIAFGVDPSIALTTVLVFRLISFWLPVAAGVPSYLRAAGGPVRALRRPLTETVSS